MSESEVSADLLEEESSWNLACLPKDDLSKPTPPSNIFRVKGGGQHLTNMSLAEFPNCLSENVCKVKPSKREVIVKCSIIFRKEDGKIQTTYKLLVDPTY